ncbi:cytochrome bc complex cytochrome b subunit [Halorhabdus sp. CBA1104]|uniref:cytochrome b n=1 Tax=Halorhabdus sp. CBA1104 TaxID=1380432 RepID=UPI0012B1C044|nr:cytochrome bc complex cytochrome b subunit [Halorhabdus sp. CBA1104]QGN07957.1 cytochrome bc complex cytochrome b subunit [Halorhabdus sp. CBA1104]
MSRTRRLYDWFDDRLDLGDAEDFLGKAFPAEDSFLLGEVALFSFVMLGLTGIFLAFFYEPSTAEMTYEGSVAKFQGEDLPAAFGSVLQLTYDVPFGMFIRRFHHWAAHLFVAAIGLHMLRVFFHGAYRNPREINWVVGTVLAILAMGAAYTGYALPFDEFASTATGIGYNIAGSIPILGDAIAAIVFGGDFPSSATIPRLYFLHVFFIPALIAVGLAAHMGLLVRQKHTEAQREEDVEPVDSSAAADGGVNHDTVDREDDSVVVGLPAVPNQAAVSAVVFFLTLATLSALAGFLPVHNIAEYGPNNPAGTPALIMPDWFFMWLYGFLKVLPSSLGFHIGPIEISAEFLGGVALPALVFLAVFAWPFIDRRRESVHFTADPFERPVQTGVGVAGVVFVMIASIAGMNNLLAEALGTTTGAVNLPLLAAMIVGPIAAFGIVHWAITREREPDESPAGSDDDTAQPVEVPDDE